MYGKMKEHLSKTLAEIREAGLYKEERLIESPQSASIQVAGKEVLNFCANNYLGLANDPRLIKASSDMMKERGFGMYVSFAEQRISTNSSKKLSASISTQRILFFMLPASTPTVVYSSRFLQMRTLSFQTH